MQTGVRYGVDHNLQVTWPKTSGEDDDECYALPSLLQQANLLSGLPNNSLSLFVEAVPA
jgi:hypothetical protein